ncbi:hypothetical protein QNH20_25055 [Neobacillus sp. WH10]|uniref:hypothetical protein n=1 Tax=Neobacillus sp. WH10 TaxID=3047873 RepID=UPI0024C0FF5A|nr:hypothetical protein [Neobacillus sp. WH10]WHY77302.1 hypothetical protein QNH20_25055 [Neobacillus sp. WH10]
MTRRKNPLIKRSMGNTYSKRNNNFYKKPSNMDLRTYVPYKRHYKSTFRKARYKASTSDAFGGCLGIIGLFIAVLSVVMIVKNPDIILPLGFFIALIFTKMKVKKKKRR